MNAEDCGVIRIAEAGGGETTATLLLGPFPSFFRVSAIDVNHSVQARETLMREMCARKTGKDFLGNTYLIKNQKLKRD